MLLLLLLDSVSTLRCHFLELPLQLLSCGLALAQVSLALRSVVFDFCDFSVLLLDKFGLLPLARRCFILSLCKTTLHLGELLFAKCVVCG